MMRFVRRLAHSEHHYVTALPAPTEVWHMIEIRKGNGVRHWSPPLLSAYSRKVGGDKPNLCDKSAEEFFNSASRGDLRCLVVLPDNLRHQIGLIENAVPDTNVIEQSKPIEHQPGALGRV